MKKIFSKAINVKTPHEKQSLLGLFTGGVSVGIKSQFIIQEGAQVPILAYCLYSSATDKSLYNDRRVSAEVDQHIFCL